MSPPLPPPFRAEHIGSLKRPSVILEAREKVENGQLSTEELKKIEDSEILRIVKMQRDLGYKSITDGEYRRHMFYDGFFDNLEGMTYYSAHPDPSIFMDYVPDVAAFKAEGFKGAETWLCTGKIKRVRPCYVSAFEFLAKNVPADEVKYIKMTMAAPEWFHLRHGNYAFSKEAYTSEEGYFSDIAKAYREEIADLYKAGCRNIQIDDPLLAYFCATSMLEGMKKEGIDSNKVLDTYIKLYNDCLEGHEKDMTIGLHLCRGNFKGGVHFSEGGYDAIAVKLFNEINCDTYYLEYDTPRAGNFEPLAHLPKNKSVVLGLISSKLAELEDPKQIASRVDEAAKIMGDSSKARICLSPQCGFASHIEGNKVTEQDVEKKLKLVQDIAHQIWSDA